MRFRIPCALVFGAALLAPLARPQSALADCTDPFAKPEEVVDFHFKMARADWTKLLASKVTNVDSAAPDSAGCKDVFEEFKAEFRCGADGEWLKVGLRKKKGEERGAEAFEKPPMKIDFNEDFMGMVPTAKGQRWPMSLGDLGYRKITLNNGQSNKSADGRLSVLPVLHAEHVTLRMLGKDLATAPKTAFAKVTMYFEDKPAGEYHGVYVLIEDIDRTALRRRGLHGTGRLEKQSTANCSPEIDFDDGPPNAAKTAYDAYIGKQPASFAGKWLDESGKGLDVDAALRQEAIREILINGNDTLFNSINPPALGAGWGNNWYAYDPRDGLRQYIPWDVDLAFGQQYGACMPTPLQCPATVPVLSWCDGPAPPYARTTSKLGRALPCNAEVKTRYLQIMCQLTNGPMAADEILKVWNQTYETLKDIVPLEKATTWKGIDPLAAPPANVVETFGSEYQRIKAWIPERIKFVQAAIGKMGVTCAAGCTNGATDTCSHLGCASMRRCENGKWTACQPVPCGAPPPPKDGGAGNPGGSDAGAAGGNSGGSGSGGQSGQGGQSGSAGSGGNAGAGSGSSGQSGSGSSSGGTGGSSTSGPRGSGGSSAGPAPAASSSGGGCRFGAGAGTDGESAPAAALLLLALVAVLRRARQRW